MGRYSSSIITSHVTANEDCYRAMLKDYIFRQNFNDLDIDDMWFQQDSFTSHTAHVTIDLLNRKFGERAIWISCYGVKSLVNANKPSSLEDIRDNN